MGSSAVPGVCIFLVVVWCVTLALPSGWHRDHGHGLKNYDLGLYKYEITKGTAGMALSFANSMAKKTGVVDKESKTGKAADKLEDMIGEGTYWINNVEEDNCLPFVDVVALPGTREWCNMWRRIRTASYILIGCIAVGGLITIASAGMGMGKTSPGKHKGRVATGILGPSTGLLGLVIYGFLTSDFPDKDAGLTYGGAFWAALVIGLVLLGISAAAALKEKVPEGNEDELEKIKAEAYQFAASAAGHTLGQQSGPQMMPPGSGQHPAMQPLMAPGGQGATQPGYGAMAPQAGMQFPPQAMMPGQNPAGFPPGTSPAQMGTRPNPLPPPAMTTGLNQLPPPPMVNSQMPSGQGFQAYQNQAPALSWGVTPMAPSAQAQMMAPSPQAQMPGVGRSNPFDR